MKENIKKFSGNELFDKALRIQDDRFLIDLDVEEFSRKFGIEVTYVDASLIRNEKEPAVLEIALNVEDGNLIYDEKEESLIIHGNISVIDGILKFQKSPQHPDSRVFVTVYKLSKEEALKLTKPL
jgi:hypothetical protein